MHLIAASFPIAQALPLHIDIIEEPASHSPPWHLLVFEENPYRLPAQCLFSVPAAPMSPPSVVPHLGSTMCCLLVAPEAVLCSHGVERSKGFRF